MAYVFSLSMHLLQWIGVDDAMIIVITCIYHLYPTWYFITIFIYFNSTVYYTCTSSQIRDTDLALSQYVTLHWLHTMSIIVSDQLHSLC